MWVCVWFFGFCVLQSMYLYFIYENLLQMHIFLSLSLRNCLHQSVHCTCATSRCVHCSDSSLFCSFIAFATWKLWVKVFAFLWLRFSLFFHCLNRIFYGFAFIFFVLHQFQKFAFYNFLMSSYHVPVYGFWREINFNAIIVVVAHKIREMVCIDKNFFFVFYVEFRINKKKLNFFSAH